MSKGEALKLAVAKVPSPGAGFGWSESYVDNQYDPCADLSWIALPSTAGTAASPWGIALFHRGVYLGTATKDPYGYTPGIIRESPSQIKVNYTYPREGEGYANRTGLAVAHFRWDANVGHVVMTGSVPPG